MDDSLHDDEQQLDRKPYSKPRMVCRGRYRGRPIKFTEGRAKQICKLIAEGNHRAVAARAVGIGERTLYDWIRDYPHFSQAIKKADALAEIEYLNIIHKRAKKSWVAAAWYLERRHPERYSRNRLPDPPIEEAQEDLEFGVDDGDRVVHVVVGQGASIEQVRASLGLDNPGKDAGDEVAAEES